MPADWNGDGVDELGVFSGGVWFLDRDGDFAFDPATEVAGWGAPGWIPITGDWDGDGDADLGVIDPSSMLWFRDLNGDLAFDAATEIHGWGTPGDIPVARDWNGDGKDSMGVFSGGVWFIDVNGDGAFDPSTDALGWGAAGWVPVPGDWDGDGDVDLGALDPVSMLWFRDVNGDRAFDAATEILGWGSPGDTPIVADWNGDGRDTAGVYSAGNWFLDLNGDGGFDAATEHIGWGAAAWTPIPLRVAMPASTAPAEGIVIDDLTDQWRTVSLSKAYSAAVIVCTPEYGFSQPPTVVRMRNVAGSSFELKLQRLDGALAGLNPTRTRCLAVEEGVYSVGTHGVKLEAFRFTSTVTAGQFSGWGGEPRAYGNSYAAPVVVGQVMSFNDARQSTFWASGPDRFSPPSPSSLALGKAVGEDSQTARADEMVGYIVMEAGVGAVGAMSLEAGLGGRIRGIEGSPPYSLALTTTHTSAVLSPAGILNQNGGQPVLYGPNAFAPNQIFAAWDEDQFYDFERTHTAEQVAFLAWTDTGAANRPPQATAQTVFTAHDTPVPITLTASDLDVDPLTFSVIGLPLHGVLSGPAPSLLYTPAASYFGPDSLTFAVSDGRGGSSQAVVSIVVGEAGNRPPTPVAQELTTPHDTPIAVTVEAADLDGDTLTLSLTRPPGRGVLSGAAPAFLYTPAPGFRGATHFALAPRTAAAASPKRPSGFR